MSHFHNTALIGASGSAGEDAYQIDRSLRFNSADSAYLSRTPLSASNRKTFTFSTWVKRHKFGADQKLFGVNSAWFTFYFTSSDNLRIYYENSGSQYFTTDAVFRDPSAWYHIVLKVDTTQSTASDRVKIYVNSEELTFSATGTTSQNYEFGVNTTNAHDIGMRSSESNMKADFGLADVHFIDGQALSPTDFGEYDSDNNWNPKAYSGSYGTNGFHLDFSDNSTDQALGYDAAVTQPTLNPRGGMDAITYTGNGSTQTISGLAFQPDFVWTAAIDASGYIKYLFDSVRGATKALASSHVQGDDAESTVSNGLTSFDPNGFTLGGNAQTNENNRSMVAWCWKAGGSASSNTDGDITTQVSVNSDYGFSISTWTSPSSADTDGWTLGHGLPSAPKFMLVKNRSAVGNWTVYHTSLGNTKALYLNDTGTGQTNQSLWNNTDPTSSVWSAGSTGWYGQSNNFVTYAWCEISGFSKFGSYAGTGNAVSVTTGFKPRYILVKSTSSGRDWLVWDAARGPSGGALQPNTNNATYSDSTYNGISFNSDGFTIMTGGSTPNMSASGETYIYAAFADRPGNNWKPNNLIAETGLETASQGMDAVTYTGTGSTQSISSLAFQPDFVWLKRRDSTGNHNIQDVVRGASAVIQSDYNGGQFTSGPRISSFDTNGFTLTSDNGANTSGGTYVAWCWKAGGTASSNTDGQITSTVSANQTYGFSVVKFTAGGAYGMRSIGHGLGVKPSLVISKRTDGSGDWLVHTDVTGSILQLDLNTGDAAAAASSYYSANTSTFSLYHGHYMDNGYEFINYCWSEVPGFSRFGSYTGNGSTTGPVVTLGFKPRFILVKGSSYVSNWNLIDTARSTSNSRSDVLRPNSSAAEFSTPTGTYGIAVDVLDDGFQLKSGSSTNDINQTNATYIYMAFADKPPGEIIDSLIDTPTNYEASSGNNGGNYATLNPLQKSSGSTLSNGNLDISMSSAQGTTFATMAFPASGKWYFECTSNATECDIGIAKADASLSQYLGKNSSGYGYYKNGTVYNNDASAGSGASYASGDIIGVAFDADAGTCKWYKNNSLQVTVSSLSGEWFPAFGAGSAAGIFNFGARPFEYTPPSNHLPLVTTNLTDPTIADGSTAMDVALWTGNSGTQTISGLGFSPDLVWGKCRSHGATAHHLTDVVRGAGKSLFSSATNAEVTYANYLTAFTSDGFTLGSGSELNYSSRTFVGWAWDAGTTTATNNNGSIQSTVRANQSAGFSITTWTGDGNNNKSVGHGLNAAPSIVIIKCRSTATSWHTYARALDSTGRYQLYLNSTSGRADFGTTFFDADSSVINLVGGTSVGINGNGSTYVAYSFAPVAGYSAFGSYTGNGSTDGPFLYTGFKPAFLIIKNTTSGVAEYWLMMDSTRSPDNVVKEFLYPNGTGAEGTQYFETDFLSNGFKIRNSSRADNYNNESYVYMAFAEHPFKTARAR